MNYAQVVEMCCRDLRRHLEEVLKSARGYVVSVKTSRVAPSRALRRRYAACISAVLGQFRHGRAYVMTKRDVEVILENFDNLCPRKEEKDVKPSVKPTDMTPSGERMIIISFHLPGNLLAALDEYARQKGISRAAAVRLAIAQLLEEMRATKETPEESECVALA